MDGHVDTWTSIFVHLWVQEEVWRNSLKLCLRYHVDKNVMVGQTSKKHAASSHGYRHCRGIKTLIWDQIKSVVIIELMQPCDLATVPCLVLPNAIYRHSMWTSCGLFHLFYPETHNKSQTSDICFHNVATAHHHQTCVTLFHATYDVFKTVFHLKKTENQLFLVAVITPSRLFSTLRVSGTYLLRTSRCTGLELPLVSMWRLVF